MSAILANPDVTADASGLPTLPTSPSLWAFLPKGATTCGWTTHLARQSGGIVTKRHNCNWWRCRFCGRWRASDVLDQILDGPAKEYFSLDLPTATEEIGKSTEKYTWVGSVDAYMSSHAKIRAALSDRSTHCNANYFAVSTTFSLLVFSDRDLSRPLSTEKRGRPAGPPHDGIWIKPELAGRYLRGLLNCGDVEKFTHSSGWPVIQTPRSASGEKFGFIGTYSEAVTGTIYSILRLVVARQLGDGADFAEVLSTNRCMDVVFKSVAEHVLRERRMVDVSWPPEEARIASMVDGSPLGVRGGRVQGARATVMVKRTRWSGSARCYGIGSRGRDAHAVKGSAGWSRCGPVPMISG
jgi:hypothetical protein